MSINEKLTLTAVILFVLSILGAAEEEYLWPAVLFLLSLILFLLAIWL